METIAHHELYVLVSAKKPGDDGRRMLTVTVHDENSGRRGLAVQDVSNTLAESVAFAAILLEEQHLDADSLGEGRERAICVWSVAVTHDKNLVDMASQLNKEGLAGRSDVTGSERTDARSSRLVDYTGAG